MNRLLVIFFIVLYSIPAIGVSVQLHYCGGKLASYSFGFNTTKKCSCGKGAENKSCCQDKVLSFRLVDDQMHSQGIDLPQLPMLELLNPSSFEYHANSASAFIYSCAYREPPDPKGQLTFLKNRVFRL
jgi:hypothetical protein